MYTHVAIAVCKYACIDISCTTSQILRYREIPALSEYGPVSYQLFTSHIISHPQFKINKQSVSATISPALMAATECI